MKNNILSSFQQLSAFKDSPFGQFWEKRLPSWALETYGPARVFNQSNFSTADASKKSDATQSAFYNSMVTKDWKDIKFFVFAHPDGNQVLKDYADSNTSPKENEVYFFIETNDGKFDFGKIVRVKLGKKAIEKLRFQFSFLNQTDEKELADEFLKRSFEINKGSDYDFIQVSKEVKLNTEELKNILAKAIKYDYQQKKFDDMSWSLKLLQGMDLLGVSIPQKLMQISGEMRAQKYDEDKYWNAEIPKDFTPLFLPRVIVPDKRIDIKESILKSLKQKIDDITNYDKEPGVLEKVYKEILGNVLLYLFDSFSSSLEEGLKILDEILPEGESLNDLYNLNAFLVGLWNGCLEFVAGIIDLIALVLVIERDGFGYTISDKLIEQLEEFFNELVFNFRDFIEKLWEKFKLAVTDFQLWYLEYGDNPYYGYKTLGELTPDILSILLPELLVGKAGRASGISEEVLSKSARELSEKLEQKTARKEVKESFNKAETELEDKIPKENKIEEIRIKPKKIVTGTFSKRTFDINNCGGPILNLSWKEVKITKEGLQIVKKHLSRFQKDEWNIGMINRLEKIEKGEIPISDFDKRFYTHEMREFERYKTLGYENTTWEDISKDEFRDLWDNTHSATLEEYKMYEKMEYNGKTIYTLYHPDVQF